MELGIEAGHILVALSRVRGLKPTITKEPPESAMVALSRVRGLKHRYYLTPSEVETSHSHECVD